MTTEATGSYGPLFEVAEETRKAIHQVDENAELLWKTQALQAVYNTAARHIEFISDDVWATGLSSTREDRALGPIMLRASRLGWITKTDRVRPSLRSHLSGKPVWRSNVFHMTL